VGGEPSPKVWVEKTVQVGALAGGPTVQALSLANLEGGRFELVATLLDSEGTALARRASAFVISPRTSIVRPGVRGTIAPPRPEVPGLVAMILGGQYLRLEETGKARTELSRALQENPRLGPAREQLAGLSLESGQPDEVFSLLEPLVKNAPERFEVLALLGRAYFQKKQYAESVATIEKAIALKRPDPPLLNLLAQAYHELGNDARAREMLERSLSLNPDQTPVKELLERLKAGTTVSR
jgi:tetratricopeptide (TPR) repeat protein